MDMSTAYQGNVLAEETHTGTLVGLLILLAMMGPITAISLARSRTPLVPVILVGVVGLFALAMAWGGFQYRFRSDGVEIRMLGFSLRTIPRGDILSYSIEPWNLIRGYGIRGIGRTRAYVWCNRVVHIRTATGEIYLGHENPERIVRDLDMVTGFVARG
jgi:hypothetical protein